MASGTKSVAVGTDDLHCIQDTYNWEPSGDEFRSSFGGNYLGHISAVPWDICLGFANVDIPSGAEVDSLVLDIVAYADSGAFPNPTIRIYGIKSTTVPTNKTGYYALASLRTTSYVDWEPGTWMEGTHYQPDDLAEVATELVNWAGWSSGSKMIFVLVDNNAAWSAQRYVCSYDYEDGSSAPHIDYTWHEAIPPESPEEGTPLVYVKAGGAWRPISAIYVNDGDTEHDPWKPVSAVYVKEEDEWKLVL